MNVLGIARMIGVKGFIAIGLAVALGVTMWRADTISHQRDKAVQLAANERAAHAITKASLDNLQRELAVYIADGKRRTEAGREALREAQGRSAALDSQIARLSARRPTAGEIERCETPATVRGLEGL